MQERRESCQLCKRDLEELREDMYGNSKPGLKYEFIGVKTKMTIVMWLLGLQLVATLGGIIKLVFS